MSQIWTPYINHQQEKPLDLTRKTTFVETPAGSSGSSTGSAAVRYEPVEVVPTVRCHYPVVLPYAAAVTTRSPATGQYYYPPPLPRMQAYPALSPESLEKPNENIPNDENLDNISLSDDLEYQIFERDSMMALADKNGGSLLGENPRMRRSVQSQQTADDSYRRQRERNNLAAKQSRDRRKLREMRLALQVSFLKKRLRSANERLAARVCARCGVSGRS